MILEIPDNKINIIEVASMFRIIAHSKRARWTNVSVRSDAVEYPYEADWLKHVIVRKHPLKVIPQWDDRSWRDWRKELFLQTHPPS